MKKSELQQIIREEISKVLNENMDINDIKYDYLERWIIGSYDGKFDPNVLDQKIKQAYPSVKKYKISHYSDSDGWNDGSFHVDVLEKEN